MGPFAFCNLSVGADAQPLFGGLCFARTMPTGAEAARGRLVFKSRRTCASRSRAPTHNHDNQALVAALDQIDDIIPAARI